MCRRRPLRALPGLALVVLLLVAAAGCGSSGTGTGSTTTAAAGAGQATDLAPAAASGNTVHGIKCESAEQLAYHIHAHLQIYDHGAQKLVPGGVGIDDNTCIYWLHTHDDTGVIHIESPDSRTFTLGDFFAVWQQPLGPAQVGPAKGTVTAYVNGKRYHGDPARIPMTLHALIQLDVGQPAPAPQPFSFPDGL